MNVYVALTRDQRSELKYFPILLPPSLVKLLLELFAYETLAVLALPLLFSNLGVLLLLHPQLVFPSFHRFSALFFFLVYVHVPHFLVSSAHLINCQLV